MTVDNRPWVPIDQALRQVEEEWLRRHDRPIAYDSDNANPFGDGRFECPIDGCDVWRVSRSTLMQHLETAHGVTTKTEAQRMNLRRLKGPERAQARARAAERILAGDELEEDETDHELEELMAEAPGA